MVIDVGSVFIVFVLMIMWWALMFLTKNYAFRCHGLIELTIFLNG